MRPSACAVFAVLVLVTQPDCAVAQGDPASADTGASAGTAGAGPEPAFRFSREAGLGLRALWEESVAAKQERVACLGTSIRNDTVFVERILALVPQDPVVLAATGKFPPT